MHPRWVLSFLFLFIYLFIAFDCSLEILERKDYLYLEGKWENGYQISFFSFSGGGGGWGGFDCSLEMFERKDYLYLEGRWVRENEN